MCIVAISSRTPAVPAVVPPSVRTVVRGDGAVGPVYRSARFLPESPCILRERDFRSSRQSLSPRTCEQYRRIYCSGTSYCTCTNITKTQYIDTWYFYKSSDQERTAKPKARATTPRSRPRPWPCPRWLKAGATAADHERISANFV